MAGYLEERAEMKISTEIDYTYMWRKYFFVAAEWKKL